LLQQQKNHVRGKISSNLKFSPLKQNKWFETSLQVSKRVTFFETFIQIVFSWGQDSLGKENSCPRLKGALWSRKKRIFEKIETKISSIL